MPGLYKCGTSWLLKSFAAHPRVIAVREIDLIRAHFQIQDGKIVRDLMPHERLRNVFFNYGFLPIRGEALRAEAQNILEYNLAPEDSVERLLALRGWTNQVTDTKRPGSNEVTLPISATDIPLEILVELFSVLRSSVTPRDSMNAFLSAISSSYAGDFAIVLKAADQIPFVENLVEWQPKSKRIVIVRDGRDASISAVHYEKLPVARKPPLGKSERSYFDVLKAWAKRARQVSTAASAGQIAVIRYEDMTNDFEQTMSALFDWSGLSDSLSILSNIKNKTSFASVTGRARGTEVPGVIRKGAVGEWQTVLSAAEEEVAWDIAGDMLTEFGYERGGKVKAGFPGSLI